MRRIIPPSHRSITGSLPTRFPARQLHYESKLERDFLMLLEIDKGIASIETQPVTVELSVDNRRRRYTPDILATWWEEAPRPFPSRKVIFEVKPLAILKRDLEELAPKYRAAKRHFNAQGVGFRVVTDRTIYRPRLANATRIGPAMRREISPELVETVRAILTYPGSGSSTFGALRADLIADGMLRDTAERGLLHLVGIGYLTADLDAPLTDTTELEWWSRVAIRNAPIETL